LWQPVYHGDYLFIRGLWDAGLRFVWWDIVASRCQQGRLNGAVELEFAVAPATERAVTR
jgi:hypothetical protein